MQSYMKGHLHYRCQINSQYLERCRSRRYILSNQWICQKAQPIQISSIVTLTVIILPKAIRGKHCGIFYSTYPRRTTTGMGVLIICQTWICATVGFPWKARIQKRLHKQDDSSVGSWWNLPGERHKHPRWQSQVVHRGGFLNLAWA